MKRSISRIGIAAMALLAICIVFTTAAKADDFKLEPGYESLFNGKDLTGWGYKTNNFDGQVDASDGRYSAQDGMIVVHPHDPAKGPRLRQMWTKEQFPKNFHLLLEFRAAY